VYDLRFFNLEMNFVFSEMNFIFLLLEMVFRVKRFLLFSNTGKNEKCIRHRRLSYCIESGMINARIVVIDNTCNKYQQ